MLTYEDLLAIGGNDRDRMDFVLKVIREHESSEAYRKAASAMQYYRGVNPTIYAYEKIIYDQLGRAHVDMWTANHKIASQFLPFVIDQEVSYLLGNGVRFGKDETKDRLGQDFDEDVQDALEYARVCGTSFGFWNLDHVDVFSFLEFAPLYSEETGALMAGVRKWQLDRQKPLRATLYEPDGFTEYIQRPGEDMQILAPKRSYKVTVTKTTAEGEIATDGENYAGFPIVPLYANKQHESALTGKRNTVDALDLSCSNMVNNVDEGNLIYWVLTNCGGMDDLDDAKFLERLKTTRIVHADGDAGATATAQSVEAPFEGTNTTIDMLTKRLYADFQAFDASAVTASNQSATAIKASYIPLDMKCDKIERQVTRFVLGILKLAGIDDKPTYQRNQLINKTEETQNLTMQAQFLDEEYIREKLLAVNGDIDMLGEINKRVDAENFRRISVNDESGADENDGEEDEAE
jgi:hypothetical protein